MTSNSFLSWLLTASKAIPMPFLCFPCHSFALVVTIIRCRKKEKPVVTSGLLFLTDTESHPNWYWISNPFNCDLNWIGKQKHSYIDWVGYYCLWEVSKYGGTRSIQIWRDVADSHVRPGAATWTFLRQKREPFFNKKSKRFCCYTCWPGSCNYHSHSA